MAATAAVSATLALTGIFAYTRAGSSTVTTTEGAVTVRCSLRPRANGPVLRFEVEDTGIGIAAADRLAWIPLGEAEAQGAVERIDVRNAYRQAQARSQLAYRVRQPCGVEAARVGHDLHALVQGQAQRLLQLTQEGLGVTEIGVAGPVAGQDQHGELGQVVTGEVVELARGEHLVHRRQPVTVETRAVTYPNCW